ncbi:hypothetical protein D3C86_1741700 [compost metagenome]
MGAGDSALCRPIGRTPGLLAHRTTAVRQVTRGLGENPAQSVGLAHEDVRHHLIAPVLGDFLPAPMGFLQERQVGRAVDRQQRIEPGIGRLLDRKTQGARGLHQALSALGHFLRRAHLPTGVVAAWMMKQLFGMEKTAHGVDTCQLTES